VTDILSEVAHFVGNLTAFTWDWTQFLVPMWLQEIQRPLRYSTFFTGTKKDRDRIRVRQERLLVSVRKLYENPATRPGSQVLGEQDLGFREIANVRRLTIWLDDLEEPTKSRSSNNQDEQAFECDCAICMAVDWMFDRVVKKFKR